ncbi:MAG: hypothetical protein M3209_05875 [Acidobacteriota bacterium]|nr:hypothetical protein [Acidobacteriota bacterium]
MNTKKISNSQFWLSIFLFLIIAATAASGAPGDLDTTFGVGGKLLSGLGGAEDSAQATAAQTDGKLVVAGHAAQGSVFQGMLVRYNADGSIDSSFGAGGRIRISTPQAVSVFLLAVKIQSDGKIVVAGVTQGADVSTRDFAVFRFETNGAPDVSFGANGAAITPIGSGRDEAHALAIQSDGKIVVAGLSYVNSTPQVALARYNADGTLDETFDGDGKIVLVISLGGGSLSSLLLQPDGKIIAAGEIDTDGSDTGDFLLVRYTTSGALDASFDEDGIVVTQMSTNPDEIRSLAYQFGNNSTIPDRIVAAGGRFSFGFAVARYNLDGSLDATFDSDGKLSLNISGYATGVLIQSSGINTRRIVLCGYNTSGDSNFIVARLNANGTYDTTFDADGVAIASFSTNHDYARGCVFQSGKIGVVGSSNSIVSGQINVDSAIARFNTDGSLDATHDADGKRTDDFGNSGSAIATSAAIQTDGKILVAGYDLGILDTSGVLRFNADGSLDNSFDADGRVRGFQTYAKALAIQMDNKIVVAGTTESSLTQSDFNYTRFNADGTIDGAASASLNASDFGNALAVQSDGKIIVAGATFPTAGNADFALARHFPTGALDGSFDADGKAITDFGTNNDQTSAIAIQADDKIVVAGYVSGTFAIARYNPDGSLDTSFNFDGKVTTPVGVNPTARGAAMKIQSDGKILLAGFASNGSNNDFALVRYNPNGSPDNSFDSDGIVMTPIGLGNDEARAIAIQSDSKILVAGSSHNGSNSDFAVVRYNANGSLDNSYGNEGKKTVDVSGGSDSGYSIALDSMDNAVIAGEANGLFGVVRLLGTDGYASISGVVTYGTGSTQKFVSGVALDAYGTTVASTTSNASGAYQLSLLIKHGQYVVTPSKTAQVNGITAFDATLVLRCVAAGSNCALTQNQRKAADSDNDNQATAFDATQILRFVAANGQNANTGQTGNWKFDPASHTYPNLPGDLSGENYTAFLIGEVDGDWTPPNPPAPINEPEKRELPQ